MELVIGFAAANCNSTPVAFHFWNRPKLLKRRLRSGRLWYLIGHNPCDIPLSHLDSPDIDSTRPEACFGHRPQRKNETVIQTCMQCGAINGAEARTCCLCDTRLSKNADAISVSSRPQLKNDGSEAVETDWRSEVTQRLDAYRERHGVLRDAGVQPQFAFTTPTPESAVQTAQPWAEARSFQAPAATITKRRFRPARVERLEIDVEQPAFDFTGDSGDTAPKAALSPYDSPVLSVAPLSERRRAAVLDITLLLFAYGGFLTVFRALGGRFNISRFDLLITMAILGLLYTQYVTLFNYFARATPGMMLRGLRVASLDGLDPSPRQLLWRSLGYLISAGTLMLGFLWVLWDEDHLSWHDRISQTCITQDLVLGGQACSQPSEAR